MSVNLLSRDQILGSDDRSYEDVDVPEWGGTVRISTLSAAARDAWERGLVDAKGKTKANVRASLVAKALVDQKGNRLFNDDDVKALGRKSSKALDRCFEAAQRVNGMTRKEAQGGEDDEVEEDPDSAFEGNEETSGDSDSA